MMLLCFLDLCSVVVHVGHRLLFIILHRGKPNLLDMGSLLIKPVQRIMKYPLLLWELWQATPEDHPDHRPLQEAFTAAKIINVNINEFKRRKDIGEISFPLAHAWVLSH